MRHEPAPCFNSQDEPQWLRYHVYTDEEGCPLYRLVRMPNKRFYTQYPYPDGKWANKLANDQTVRKVLYRLPTLMQPSNEPIFIVEGEKDVETIEGHGRLATTSGGAQSFHEVTEHARQVLKGRILLILPDNDAAGQDYARSVVQALFGVAAEIRVVTLPNLPPRGDVTDWLDPQKCPQGNQWRDVKLYADAAATITADHPWLADDDSDTSPHDDQHGVRYLCIPNSKVDHAVNVPTHYRFENCAGIPTYSVPKEHGGFVVSLRPPADGSFAPFDVWDIAQHRRPTTHVTGLAFLALWHQRVPDNKKIDQVLVPLDDLLTLLGKHKHNGSWRTHHLHTLVADLRYLSLLHVHGRVRLLQNNTPDYPTIDSQYLTLVSVTEERQGVPRIVGFSVAPGAWYQKYIAVGNIQLTAVDPQVLAMNSQNQRYEQAICLYLSAEWRKAADKRTYAKPFVLADVFDGSGIPIDKENNPGRSAQRAEGALRRLVESGRVASMVCQTPLDKQTPDWLDRWLRSEWIMLPPDDLVDEFERWLHRADEGFVLPRSDETFAGCLPQSVAVHGTHVPGSVAMRPGHSPKTHRT